MKKHLPPLLLTAGLLIATYVVITFTAPPTIVVFDIEQTLDRYQDKLLEAKVSDSEHAHRLAAFDQALRRILDEYAQQHHLTIVVPGAVISGAPDMTDILQRHVIEELKKTP